MYQEFEDRIKILKEYCLDRNIELVNIDPDSNLVWQITGDKRNFIYTPGSYYPINSPPSIRLAKDKTWTYKVLSHNGINVPVGEGFFTVDDHYGFDTSGRRIEQAQKFAESLGYPVFVKPNSSSMGRLANPDNNSEELASHFEDISETDHMAIVQQKITLPEYRIFTLNGEVEFAYRKSSTTITGNGTNTLEELLIDAGILDSIIDDPYYQRELKRLEYSPSTILPKGQVFHPSPNNNLNLGGSIREYTEQVREDIRTWAGKVSNSLGLRLAGIDLFTKSLDDTENFIVLEVNGTPSLKSIYQNGKEEKVFKILDKMFESHLK